MKFTSLAATIALIDSAQAWGASGHLLTSRIAQEVLQQRNPKVYNRVLEILSTLEKSNPELTNREGKHPFTECTTWADAVKHQGGTW